MSTFEQNYIKQAKSFAKESIDNNDPKSNNTLDVQYAEGYEKGISQELDNFVVPKVKELMEGGFGFEAVHLALKSRLDQLRESLSAAKKRDSAHDTLGTLNASIDLVGYCYTKALELSSGEAAKLTKTMMNKKQSKI